MSEGTGGERIAKRIARAGICSRREAERLIERGRVAVDGRVIESPALDVTSDSVVTIDGEALPALDLPRLFRFHKPRGVLTTERDPRGRETIYHRLPAGLPRLMPVGRLDYNSEGLLLLTNDGGVKRRLELPATGWLRRYRVRVHGTVTQAQLDTLEPGVTIEGMAYGPIKAVLDRVQGSNAWLTVSLREGRNREVRKVMAHLGLDVTRLIRSSFGPFHLGSLATGEVDEVSGKVLREQLGAALPAAAPGQKRRRQPAAPSKAS